jgi:hypothetical protein
MPFTLRSGIAAVTISAAVVEPFCQLTHNPIWSESNPLCDLANVAVGSSIIPSDMALVTFQYGMPLTTHNIPNLIAANSLTPLERLTAVGSARYQMPEEPNRSTFEESSEPRLTLSSENVRYTPDPLWRSRWLSIQRLGDWLA